MNLQNKVNTIMTQNPYTLNPKDKLQAAKDLFGTYPFHHIPIVENDVLVGILSKQDLLYFLKPIDPESFEKYINEIRLKNYTIEEAMTKRVVPIDPESTIESALEIFSDNLFHALPVVKNGVLVGMLTTQDIIFKLLHPKKEKLWDHSKN